MTNGIDLILADHRKVDELFARFASAEDANVVGQIIDSLKAHDEAEQSALYPLFGQLLDNADLIARWAAAHSAVKKQIDLLTTLEGPPLISAVKVLQRIVAQHVADEEKSLLPALAAAATPQQLEALGARIMQAKQRVG